MRSCGQAAPAVFAPNHHVLADSHRLHDNAKGKAEPITERSLMRTDETTCWTMIDAVVKGDSDQREEFARRYVEPIKAYLGARWRNSPCLKDLDDAVQEVFIQCFDEKGPLERVDRACTGGFRPYFYGIVQNVARSFERRVSSEQQRSLGKEFNLEHVASDESSLSAVYDRAWAKSMMQEAARRQLDHAQETGEAAVRRVELLRLRFHDGLPIREIAQRWNIDSTILHHEYAKARNEFKTALVEVVAFNNPGSQAEVERECTELLDLLE